MKRIGLFAVLSIAAASTASAQVGNTGTGGGATDPFWSVSWTQLLGCGLCGSGGGAAFIVPNANVPSPPWNPNNGTATGPNWISAWTNASSAPLYSTGNNAVNYQYDFSTSVGTSGSYTLGLGWDNQLIGVYQNNVLLYGPSAASGFCRDGDGIFPGSAYPICTTQVTLSLSSAYALVIKVTGDGTTDGLFVQGGSASGGGTAITPEPATMTLVATGLVGMLGAGMKRRRNTKA